MATSRRFWARLWEAKHHETLVIAILWLAAVVGALTRPFLPIDETRYVSVAWEMWHSHSWWVPLMNGEAYADKPPLLFWVIHVGWGIFGVNEWWPKLVGPLASLVAMSHLYRIARRLGYAGSRARLAPMLMMAMLMWSLYSSALMFDILLTACLLGAINPLIQGRLTARKSLVSGVWLGLALLAKGPAVFVTLVPILLTMPWWREKPLGSEGRVRLGLSLLIGTSVLLCWALSASWFGGSSYARELLWGQSVDRLHDAMAHAHSWWWYIPWLPLITFPWLVWPSTWPRLPRLRYQRLAWVWLVIPLIVFSLISGKQIHYLMPLIPALALVTMDRIGQSQLISGIPTRTRAPALAIGLLGVVGLWLMLFGKGAMGPSTISPLGAIGLIVSACLLWRWRWASTRAAVRGIALGTSLAVLIATQFMLGPFWNRFDVGPPSALLAQLESQDVPVAFNGSGYQATFQFAGRLKRPLMTLDGTTAGMCEFKKRFPSGWIVARNRDVNHLIVDNSAIHTFEYRGGQLDIGPIRALFSSAQEVDCTDDS